MLNSAQHARSAASRLDDVIDRSALEQAREGLGGRDTEEAAHLDSERKIRKITFEVRGRRSPRNSHPYDRRHDRHPPCIAFLFLADPYSSEPPDNRSVIGGTPFGQHSDSEMARNPVYTVVPSVSVGRGPPSIHLHLLASMSSATVRERVGHGEERKLFAANFIHMGHTLPPPSPDDAAGPRTASRR